MIRFIVRELEANGVHGIPSIKLEGLSDRVTVVRAPNATGKSTLARALGFVLEPKDHEIKAGSARAVLEDGEIRVVRPKDPKLSIFNGRTGDYLLDLAQLMEGLGTAGTAELARELAGGLQLKPPSVSKPSPRQASQALDDLKRARSEAKKIVDIEDDLPRLRNQSEESGKAKDRAEAIQRIIDRRAIRARIESLNREEQELVLQHPGIDRQTPDAETRLRQINEDLDGSLRNLERSRKELSDGYGDSKPPRPLSKVDSQRLTAASETVRSSETAFNSTQDTVNQAAAKRDSYYHQVFKLGAESPESYPVITPDDFNQVQNAAQAALDQKKSDAQAEGYRMAAQSWQEQYAPPAPDAAEIDREMEAIAEDRPDQRVYWLAGLAIFGAWAAWLIGKGMGWIAGAVATVASILVFILIKPGNKGDRRERVRNLRTLLDRSSRSEAGRILKAKGAVVPVENEWKTIAGRLHLNIEDPLQSAALANAILNYQAALAECDAATSTLEMCRQKLDASLADVGIIYQSYGFSASGPSAEQAFRNWFKMADQVDERAKEVESKKTALLRYLEDQGVPAPFDAEELSNRRAPATRLKEIKDLLIREQAQFDAIPVRAAEREFEGLADEVLEQKKQLLELASSLAEDRLSAVKGAEAAIEFAERNARLPAAERAYQEKYAELELDVDRFARARAAEKARAWAMERIRGSALPKTLEIANRHMEVFTNGRYRLESGSAAQTNPKLEDLVCVVDEQRGWDQDFGQLSTATKVHMIIALKLARIEVSEEGSQYRFPLILDEAMAVSDPDASHAIAETLGEIAKGRQVIVFTNQPQDAKLIKSIVPDAVERTLTHSTLPSAQVFDENGSPNYIPAVGPGRITLTCPLRSHAPIAVGIDSPEPTLHLHCRRRADDETRAFLDSASPIFKALGDEYRIPTTDQIVGARGVGGKAAAVRDLYTECPNVRSFLEKYACLDGVGRSAVSKMEDWLDENGFLWTPPSRLEIRARFTGVPQSMLLETLIDGIADALGSEV